MLIDILYHCFKHLAVVFVFSVHGYSHMLYSLCLDRHLTDSMRLLVRPSNAVLVLSFQANDNAWNRGNS